MNWIGLLLGLFIGLSPTVTLEKVDRTGEHMRVSFPKGAVYACTTFQEQVVREPDANFPDGMYAPKHCWLLDETDTGYDEDWLYIKQYDSDWKVWVEVQYDNGDLTVKSNTLTIHR